MPDQSTTDLAPRQTKAIGLINAGAITLNLDGTATVRGSGKALYTVTKADGCNCPDRARRGPGCKHELAAQTLCKMYRQCQREVRETGRTRLPWALGLALPKGKAPAPKVTLDDILFNPSDLDNLGQARPAGALVDDRGTPYCHDCGSDLIDGRCPHHYPRWAAGFGSAA